MVTQEASQFLQDFSRYIKLGGLRIHSLDLKFCSESIDIYFFHF
ncbi:hypothetical protein T4C_7039 [Trichinella pseudospiralis]|uniref:Uncharacterized protein n=1 Tax=Trichinella pseudospiralis TaxID=6337 RepID=A0A0V1GJX0_TRIPS|nr:hypothetical protein T4C_7039 [Trichinella pseudospiralis]